VEVRAAAEQVFATNDPAEARSLLTSIYVPHELRSRDGLPLNFKIRYLQSSRLTLGHVRYGADSEVLVPPMEHCYHLNITLAGRTIASQGGSSVSTMPGGTAVMFGPERARAVRWSPDAVQYAVKIPRASLEGQLAALLGRPVDRPLRFALDVDLAGPQGQSLLAAIGHLRTELSRTGGLTESPLVRAQLESYVLSQLLFVVPSDHHELLQEVGQRVGRRHIRVALDYIDEHLAEPLAGPDIAKAASVSLRALQAGFQDDIGMSPMAYVRSRRLDRVHEELLADADGALINEVAARWGFFHFGRFAEQYRMRFGVLPSMTAREGRTRRSR
jgi:AraC-like DNA-binding protein